MRHSRGVHDLHLRFFGGEPLLELELLQDVASYARYRTRDGDKKFKLDLITNGTLLNREARELLRILAVGAILSVDGRQDSMSKNRGIGCSDTQWKIFEANVRSAIELGIVRQFRVTFTPGSGSSDVAADLRSIANYGKVPILATTSTGTAWSEEQVEIVYRGVEEFYLATVRSGEIPLLIETNRLLTKLRASAIFAPFPSRKVFCLAGSRMLAVDTIGNLMLCHRMLSQKEKYNLGNILTGVDFAGQAPFIDLDKSHFHIDSCAACEAKNFCAGSCMAANVAKTESLFLPEPRHCLDLKAHLRMAQRILDAYRKERWPPMASVFGAEDCCVEAG